MFSHEKDLESWLNRIGLGTFQQRLRHMGVRHLCHRDYVTASDLEKIGMNPAQVERFFESDQVSTCLLKFMR